MGERWGEKEPGRGTFTQLGDIFVQSSALDGNHVLRGALDDQDDADFR